MEKHEAIRIIGMLVAAYPNWHPPEETARLYAVLLEPFPAGHAERAVMEIIIGSDREFAPPFGVIAHKVAEVALAEEGKNLMTAEEAWAIVQQRLSYYSNPAEQFTQYPTIYRAVKAMDWGLLCTDPNIAASRAHFFRLFNAFKERELKEKVLELTGDASMILQLGNKTGRLN